MHAAFPSFRRLTKDLRPGLLCPGIIATFIGSQSCLQNAVEIPKVDDKGTEYARNTNTEKHKEKLVAQSSAGLYEYGGTEGDSRVMER